MRLFRIIVPVADIDAAAMFYGAVLGQGGERVTSGRHYFDCGGVLLACLDALADGDPEALPSNSGHVYFATEEPLDLVRERATDAGALLDSRLGGVGTRPWGERSFYARDPWGNPFAVVQHGSEYVGGPF